MRRAALGTVLNGSRLNWRPNSLFVAMRLGGVALLCQAVGFRPALAQAVEPGVGDAKTSDVVASVEAAATAFAQHPAAIAVVIGVALLFGVALGWVFLGGKAAPVADGPRDVGYELRSARPGPTRGPERSAPGMIFREDEADAPPALRRGDRAARETREGRLLFDYFEDRFGLRERSAKAAVDYLEQVGDAVERVRRRAQSAETALERSLERTAEAAAVAASIETPAGGAVAALKVAMEGVKTARTAMHTLRGRADPLFEAFAVETDIDDTLRRVAGLHAAHADGSTVDPEVILEPWPHALLRAEALAVAYFPADGLWGELREGLSAVAAGLRRAMREANVVVGHVRLLTPYRQIDGEVWSDQLGELERLEPVRSALQRTVIVDEVIVDCEAFGYVDRGRGVSGRARLIVAGRD
ncbi:MAG: hypothetical protein MRY74_04850 [Neomegalonema sp.]|nr:hypothetical protein [Neomegalonema sp.]